jgi:hypothetical protein
MIHVTLTRSRCKASNCPFTSQFEVVKIVRQVQHDGEAQ